MDCPAVAWASGGLKRFLSALKFDQNGMETNICVPELKITINEISYGKKQSNSPGFGAEAHLETRCSTYPTRTS